jgi:immune inhibitor A
MRKQRNRVCFEQGQLPMSRRNSLTQPIALIAALIFLVAAPAAAQTVHDNPDYPTVEALNAAVIPLRDRVELAERLRGVNDIPPTPASAPTRQVGEHEVFTASNDDLTLTIPATLQVVGDHIYLWVEDNANVNLAELQALARDFDTLIYPNVRDLWGDESNPGVDGDSRIYALFAHNLGASVAAYFASDHTFPKEVVPYSNEHEMFFFNLDATGSNLAGEDVESIVSHEFQHMIRFNLQQNTETWLNEGLSEFTQFYFYGQLDGSVFSFLGDSNTQLNSWNAEPGGRAANYGAAALFLTYFYDRYGIDAMSALSADHDLRALDAVDAVLLARGEPGVNDFFGDWVLANLLLDPTFEDGRYGYQNLVGLIPPLFQDVTSRYPFTYQGEANQYAAHYFDLHNLGEANALDIHLDAPASVGLIPARASSGVHFWYSNRADMADMRLTHTFDLSDVTAATLNYRLWYDIEADWDYGYVMVSDDDGATWDILPAQHTTSDDPQHVAYGVGYSGASAGWVDESLPLDAYAGKEILVRFEMITDDGVTRPGIGLDDVSIPEIGYSTDFEADDGGWQPEGWLWTDNRLPESGWLQVAQKAGEETIDVQRWQIDQADYRVELEPGVDEVVVALSPFAPVTTVPMPYTLTINPS